MHAPQVENQLPMPDYFCVCMMPFPLAVSNMPWTARAGRCKRTCFPCRCHAYIYGTIAFCLVFSKEFNILSTLSAHQSPTLPQKIDSRGGLFWCKLGLACECSKMYFYLKRPPFAPVSELFGAKWSAFCCKMECILVLNARRFGAKCSAFWCKTQGKMLLNAWRKA